MANQLNIINEMGTLTHVPNKILDLLIEKENLCIGSAIHEALLEKQNTVVLDIGIGTLSIDLIEMQCKFVPSKALKTIIKKCISNNIDPLEIELEEAIIQKLTNIYQEAM